MSKIFKYRHNGIGGCGKVAFFTLTRPVAGQPLSDMVVIQTDGAKHVSEGALMCGHCGNGVLGLKLDNLKPARQTDTVDLLVKSINRVTMKKAEINVIIEVLGLLHELCSKIDPKLIPYVGSELEASVKGIVGESLPGIVDSNGMAIAAND